MVINKLKTNFNDYKVENPDIKFKTWFKQNGCKEIAYYANENYNGLKTKINVNFNKFKIK